MATSFTDVPVEYEDHGAFVVWDLCEWDGDVETMEAINEAWMEVHDPPEKVGTISVFPEDVIVDGELQSFIADGWNEAGEAVGLEHLAIVGESLAGIAVKSQIEMPDIDVDVFGEVDDAVAWLEDLTN
ncbi:hypothetical protein RYH80_06555 [Halobaculum sp. MBLA0147]|uniref:hypothetical protein n=1 Tax=Halobaculum sp. MBLA0147 TaxID=3079934 RepID=UPI0035269E2C